MEDLVGAELEALEYTYGAEALTVLQTAPLHLSVSIAPHTGDLATERYVNADLMLQTTAAYPDEAPKLALLHAKGNILIRASHHATAGLHVSVKLSACPVITTLLQV